MIFEQVKQEIPTFGYTEKTVRFLVFSSRGRRRRKKIDLLGA